MIVAKFPGFLAGRLSSTGVTSGQALSQPTKHRPVMAKKLIGMFDPSSRGAVNFLTNL